QTCHGHDVARVPTQELRGRDVVRAVATAGDQHGVIGKGCDGVLRAKRRQSRACSAIQLQIKEYRIVGPRDGIGWLQMPTRRVLVPHDENPIANTQRLWMLPGPDAWDVGQLPGCGVPDRRAPVADDE